MPPAANPNPNPDRFRRAGSVAPAAEAKDELVPEPLLPVRAPAAAPIVASAAPAAAAPVVCVSGLGSPRYTRYTVFPAQLQIHWIHI